MRLWLGASSAELIISCRTYSGIGVSLYSGGYTLLREVMICLSVWASVIILKKIMFHGAKIVNKDELQITKKGGNKVVTSKNNRTFVA